MPGEIGQRIKQAREAYRGVGMKQNALASLIKVSPARLSNWEKGLHDPNGSFVAQLARFLEVPTKWLLTGVVEPADETPALPEMMPTTPQPMGKLKLMNAASAGRGNAYSIHDVEVEVPAILCRDDYGALYVDGNSMEPLLFSTDIAIFQQAWEARKGQVVCATIGPGDDEEWVIKKIDRDAKNGQLVLASLNESYEPIPGPFTIKGILVGYYRVEGPETSTRYNPLGLK